VLYTVDHAVWTSLAPLWFLTLVGLLVVGRDVATGRRRAHRVRLANTRPFAERLFAGVPSDEAFKIAAGNMLAYFTLHDTPMGRTALAGAAAVTSARTPGSRPARAARASRRPRVPRRQGAT
jgi:hypothetical protein